MAELNTGGDGGGKGGKVRAKKQNPAVDLTAMVDLAFLLITFFMLTTTLSKPQSMNLAMPDKPKADDPTPPETPAFRTLSLLLGSDNTIVWYRGQPDEPLEGPEVERYGKEGIRKVILEKSKKVLEQTGDPKKPMTVLIKPSEKASYENLVDILDEMAITQEKTYAIVELVDEDIEMLTQNNAY